MTKKTGIKIKCCVCGELSGNLNSDHLNESIIKQVETNGFYDGDDSYVCDSCDSEYV